MPYFRATRSNDLMLLSVTTILVSCAPLCCRLLMLCFPLLHRFCPPIFFDCCFFFSISANSFVSATFRICAEIFPPLMHNAIVFSFTSSCTCSLLSDLWFYPNSIRHRLCLIPGEPYRPRPNEISFCTGASCSRTPCGVGRKCRDGHCPFPDAGASYVQTGYS